MKYTMTMCGIYKRNIKTKNWKQREQNHNRLTCNFLYTSADVCDDSFFPFNRSSISCNELLQIDAKFSLNENYTYQNYLKWPYENTGTI